MKREARSPLPRSASRLPGGVTRRRALHGAFLLEALVAVVVFALALLALTSAVISAVRQAGGATWRSEALDLGAATLARMTADDPASLAPRYADDAGGDGYAALLARALRLPGVSASRNAPRLRVVDDGDMRRILLTLYWQVPGEESVHRVALAGIVPP